MAITVSDPVPSSPSSRPDAEDALHPGRVAIAQGQPTERIDQHDDVPAGLGEALGVAHRQLGLAHLLPGLLLGRCGEDLGLGQCLLPLGDLLGALVGEQHAEVGTGLGNRRAEASQERRPPRARLGQHEHPLAEGERAEQVDRPHHRVQLRIRREHASMRRRRGEVLEVATLILGALPVDRLDPDQSAVPLAAPRSARGASHLVAGA